MTGHMRQALSSSPPVVKYVLIDSPLISLPDADVDLVDNIPSPIYLRKTLIIIMALYK
jgi:hypothetical protein